MNLERTTLPGGQRVGHEERAGKWTVLAIVAIGVFMATLDSSIVNISLPAIAAYFRVPLSGAVEWVIIAYLVVVASLLLTVGRLADMVGQKPIWIAGLVIFTLGSALCGAAPTLGLLVAFRVLQGVGGAFLMAISPAMLTRAFPSNERGRALGLNALFVALGVSAGPTLGGLITENLGFRYIFYINLPFGLIGLFAAQTRLTERARKKRTQFDLPGALLLFVGLASLSSGLSFGQEIGWTSPLFLVLMDVAALSLILLVLHERQRVDPLIDLCLFRDRVFASAIVSLVLSFLALFAVSFMMPFYLEQLRGFSLEESGALLTPLPLTIAAISPLSGALADRIGTRWLAATGLLIACFGLLLVGRLGPDSSIEAILISLSVTGLGQALFQPPNNSALLGAAPRAEQGVASGTLATGRVIGQCLSVALAGAIFSSLGGAGAGSDIVAARQNGADPARIAALGRTFSHSFRVTFDACAAIAVIGVFASLVRGDEGRRRLRRPRRR